MLINGLSHSVLLIRSSAVQTDRAACCISRTFVNCCTTNSEQIKVMDLDGYSRLRSVVLKKKWGMPETRLRQRFFLNNLGLHTRTLGHIRNIAQRIFSLVLRYSYSCLSVCSRSILILLYLNYLTLRFSK